MLGLTLPSFQEEMHQCLLHRNSTSTKSTKPEYVAPKKPVLIQTKPPKYLAITGRGTPGGKSFRIASGPFSSVAFTIKMAKKFAGKDYKVSNLEGLWWGEMEGEDFFGQAPGA